MPQSGIREIFDKVQQSDDLADLSIGEPDFDTPEPITATVREHVGDGAGSYTQTVGRADLRRELAAKLRTKNSIDADPDSEIIVTPGAMGALFAAVNVLCDAGDEVLVPEPHWPNYAGHLASAGAELVPVPTNPDSGFVVTAADVADAVTADTTGFLLNNPNNPTGAVVPGDEVAAIGKILIDEDLWCVADETYEDLVYGDAEHVSITSDIALFDRVVTVHSFSKSYAMTGWRVGYASGPADVVNAMRVLQEHTVSCVAEPSQVAAMAALNSPEVVVDIHEAFEGRRRAIFDRLDVIKGVEPGRPGGAFYVFADVSALTDDSRTFVESLINDAGVAAIPGSVFGTTGEGHVRFSYATSESTIEEAMDRFERAISSR
jgi:aspartate aminotransferase/aminotransferase